MHRSFSRFSSSRLSRSLRIPLASSDASPQAASTEGVLSEGALSESALSHPVEVSSRVQPSRSQGSNASALRHHDQEAFASQDIRLSAPARFRRSSWVNATRILSLVGVDILLVQLSQWVIEMVHPPTAQLLTQLYGGSLLLPFSGLAFIAVGGGYRSGMGKRGYRMFAWSMLLASAISIAAISHSSIAHDLTADNTAIPGGWPTTQFLAVVALTSCWQALLLYASRQFITRFVSQLRDQKIACYSVLIIAEEWNQAAIRTLVERQGRYEVVRVENSTALDRTQRSRLLTSILNDGIDEVFIDWSSIHRRLFLLQYLRASKSTIRLLPVEPNVALDKLKLLKVDTLTTYTLPTESPLFSRFSIKRCCDFAVSAVVLLLLSPLLLTVALLIKLDSPGPILYRQTRVGLKGQKFEVWKFRSMVINADKLQEKLEALNESGDGVLFKIRQDPRITKVGRFIRRYSIDELPQLLNVLLGQMSLVGPRPLPVRDVQRFSQESFFIRNEVLPGITGLWQVSGRSDVEDFEAAFHLDMDYIENWSLGLDFHILLKTIAVVLFPKGAY